MWHFLTYNIDDVGPSWEIKTEVIFKGASAFWEFLHLAFKSIEVDEAEALIMLKDFPAAEEWNSRL